MKYNNIEKLRQTGRTHRVINKAVLAAKSSPEKSFYYYVLTSADKASLERLLNSEEFPDNLNIKICEYYQGKPRIFLDEESFYDHTVFELRYPELINAYLECIG